MRSASQPCLRPRSARVLSGLAMTLAVELSLTPALAHDLWVVADPWAPVSGRLLRLDLATGMRFPTSEGALGPDRIVRAILHRPDGVRDLPRPRQEGNVLRYEVTAGAAGLTRAVVETAPRFIRLKAEEFEAYLREEGLTQASEERRRLGESGKEGSEFYAKIAVAYVRVGDGEAAGARRAGPRAAGAATVGGPPQGSPECCRPLGLRIEIVPAADPTLLKAGQTLGVQVLYRGRSLPGVLVRAAPARDPERRLTVLTDAEGRAAFRLDTHGPWALACIQMERRSERSQADWDSHWASLSFAIHD